MQRPWPAQQQAIKAVICDTTRQDFNCIAIVNPQIGQALSQHAIEQRTHTRTVNLYADKILLRRGCGHFQQGVAHAKADFQRTRCRATKYLIEIDRRISQRQYVQRRTLIETALLAFSHATGTHHETFDATVLAIVAFFRDWGVE